MTDATPARRPKLSVVVPFYNVAAYLGVCLESLRNQLLSDVEVIMVDDGSTDDSVAIARHYASQDSRFRLVQQENKGLGPARNTGTRHAVGEYLTFVDSDDLVPPRAYTLMVGSLEKTGSAFAAGNAYRFSATKGVEQSWTHREPFAETRLQTTLAQTPTLIRDRMVWNKVYRRSFWDDGRFEFPAIRYEDYMVTLRAYLEAPSVDVFSDHVYFWRNRESGDSITQQAARADNAIDRYLSAGLVLDVLRDHRATDEVRERVHAYFIHIDVVALAESMVAVAPEHRAEAERMALDLASRLTPGAQYETTRLARLIHERLLDGDLETVRALAKWRTSSNHRDLARFLARHPNPRVVWVAGNALLASRRPQNPFAARRLRTKLTSAHWRGNELELHAALTLRARFARDATVTAHLRGQDLDGKAVQTPLSVVAQSTPTGLALVLSLNLDETEQLPRPGELVIEVKKGTLRWSGGITFEPDALPELRRTRQGWFQLRGFDGHLGLERLDSPAVLESTQADDSSFQLTLHSADPQSKLVLRRPAPTDPVTLNTHGGTALVEARTLIAGDPPDDVVTGIAERSLVTSGESSTNDSPVYLIGSEARVYVDNVAVRITRDARGHAVVRQEPHTSADDLPATP